MIDLQNFKHVSNPGFEGVLRKAHKEWAKVCFEHNYAHSRTKQAQLNGDANEIAEAIAAERAVAEREQRAWDRRMAACELEFGQSV